MSRKRKTKEEIREKAKIARRKRYEGIKSNPVLYALEKEKERQRYIRRKEQKNLTIDYFEDFDQTNHNTLNTRQNILQELERNHLKKSHPSISGSSGLRKIVENCSEDDSFGALPINLSQVSQGRLESDKSYIGSTAKFKDNFIIKRPTKALLKRFFNSSSNSDSNSEIFPKNNTLKSEQYFKRQYFKK